jgi:hypothetical protein
VKNKISSGDVHCWQSSAEVCLVQSAFNCAQITLTLSAIFLVPLAGGVVNHPSGACAQYRADRSSAPYAELGSFEWPLITLNIFQNYVQNLSYGFPRCFVCQVRRPIHTSLFTISCSISATLGLRVINESCYSLVLTGTLKEGVMVQGYVVYLSGIPRLNLPLSQSQDCFVVGTVRAQRLSHSRCLATVCNGAG